MVSNHRPIALQPSLNKIFEEASRLMSDLKKYKLIADAQYSFREGISKKDATVRLTGEIYTQIEHKRPAICVFLARAIRGNLYSYSVA